jgi:TolB protein
MRTSWLILAPGLAALALAACGGDGGDESLSPPTGNIAFVSDRDGNQEIYLMSADGAGHTNLTNDPADDKEPWWSPDGTQLAFQSSRAGPPNIFLMNADGSGVSQLIDSPAVEGRLRWSSDGSKVAFYSFRSQGQGMLWVANADGSDPRPVLQGIHPAGPEAQCAAGFPGDWFPDSDTILFRGSYGAASALQICSVNADGSDLKVIFSQDNSFAIYPTLSPDNTRIAMVLDRGGNEDVYVVDIDGRNLRQVIDDPAQDTTPVWSPDGEWIAFASVRDGDMEVYIVRPDGDDLRQLTDNEFADGEPAWSAP